MSDTLKLVMILSSVVPAEHRHDKLKRIGHFYRHFAMIKIQFPVYAARNTVYLETFGRVWCVLGGIEAGPTPAD